MPRNTHIVPSVMMNGWTRQPHHHQPLASPQSRPIPRHSIKAANTVTTGWRIATTATPSPSSSPPAHRWSLRTDRCPRDDHHRRPDRHDREETRVRRRLRERVEVEEVVDRPPRHASTCDPAKMGDGPHSRITNIKPDCCALKTRRIVGCMKIRRQISWQNPNCKHSLIRHSPDLPNEGTRGACPERSRRVASVCQRGHDEAWPSKLGRWRVFTSSSPVCHAESRHATGSRRIAGLVEASPDDANNLSNNQSNPAIPTTARPMASASGGFVSPETRPIS